MLTLTLLQFGGKWRSNWQYKSFHTVCHLAWTLWLPETSCLTLPWLPVNFAWGWITSLNSQGGGWPWRSPRRCTLSSLGPEWRSQTNQSHIKWNPRKNTPFSGMVCHAFARGVVHLVLSVNFRDRFLNSRNLSKAHEKLLFSNFRSYKKRTTPW